MTYYKDSYTFFTFFCLHFSCLLAVYFLLLQSKIRLIIFMIFIVGNVVDIYLFFITYLHAPILFPVFSGFFYSSFLVVIKLRYGYYKYYDFYSN
jgi:hypothetical protein